MLTTPSSRLYMESLAPAKPKVQKPRAAENPKPAPKPKAPKKKKEDKKDGEGSSVEDSQSEGDDKK